MDVKVYTTESCPHCKKLKGFLKENDVDFKNIDIGEDQEAAQEMMEKSGQSGVPVTEIDGEFIVGFDEDKLKEKLDL